MGRGGMGIVFLARDVILERPVAIKLLAPFLASREDMRRRFLREARIAAQCFHPNIVPIHEVAESGELAWFVMGYVPGESLAERLHRVGPLPSEAVKRIGREIGWALSYAHERGVVHRDVKPENILLEHGTDRALIADFGIALRDPAITGHHDPLASGEVAGTARFMAPEQALGDTVDGRSDLYALGVTLYLAATGRYPFDGGNALAIVAQQSVSRAPSVRALAPAMSGALADAIDQCLAPRAAERFDNAAAFVAALERSPDAMELPTEARATHVAMTSALTLAEWTVAIGLASVFLVLGEEARSLGRAIMISLVQGIVLFMSASTAMRGAEALLAARRALKAGLAPDDVANALAPAPTAPLSKLGPVRGAAMISTACALALAQGQIDSLALPSGLELLGNVVTWMLPPMIIQRAIAGLRRSSGVSGWLYSVVRKPLAQYVVRWLGGATTDTRRPVPGEAHTEVLLGQAADAIFARLPNDAQRDLRALPAATAALAEQAVALRAKAVAISGELRHIRRGAQHDVPRRSALEQERQDVERRLGTTIAALEAIRLDLLRLDAGASVPGSLTEQLDVVRDLQRRVDAADAVERMLHPRAHLGTPETTPV